MSDGEFAALGSSVWDDFYVFVYRNLREHGISHFDAEDLAQDVLETAYRHLDDVDPHRRHAWLRAVVRNKLVDRARRPHLVHTVADVPESPDPGLGPDEVALRSADRLMLHEAMALLPERDRRLVEVRYLEDRSVVETASELGMSVGATKVALHRARQRLRETIEDRAGTVARRLTAMAGIADRAVLALTPYIGRTAADTCVRATAIVLGKSYDTLAKEDFPTLADRIRGVLTPLLPPDTIDRLLEEIRWDELR